MTPGRFPFCRDGLMCQTCRSLGTGSSFRRDVATFYSLSTEDFPCPVAAWGDDRPRFGIGDLIARMAAWLRIRPWKGCKCQQRRAWLNRNQAWIAGGVLATLLAGAWR